MKTIDIDNTANDNVRCPYCGDEDTDSWELRGEDGQAEQTECGNCGKQFLFTRNVNVTYDSRKADCLNGDADHSWKNIVAAPREYAVGKQCCENCFSDRTISTEEWEAIEADHNHPQNWRVQ